MDKFGWALAAVERATRAMGTSASEAELCQACCDAITSASPYPLAWIGFAEQNKKRSVRVVAKSGAAIGYLDGIHLSWSDNSYGNGTTGMAIKTGLPQFVNDIAGHAAFKPWHVRAKRLGLRATVTLPIKDGDATIASLSVYAEHADAFDETIARLLASLAEMIGFGLQMHRTQARLIAARLQAEKLHDLQLLEALTEASTDAIFVKDTKGRYQLCNQAVVRELGLPREQILGRSSMELSPHAQAAQTAARDKEVLTQSHPVTYELSLATPSGLRTFLTTKGRLVDPNGRVMGLYGIARDITDRKLVEQKQRELLAFNQAILEKSPMGIAVFQADGTRIMSNEALAQMVGCTKDQLMEVNFYDIPPLEKSGVHDLAREALELGKTGRREHNALTSFGKEMHVDATVTSFQIAGKPHLLVMYNDISERKLVENKQQELLAFNQTILETSPMGIAVFRADGQCIMANEALVQMLGGTKEQILATNFHNIASWEKSGTLKLAQEVFASGKTGRGNLDAVTAYKKRVRLDITITPIMISGEPHIVALHVDISDRVKSEKALLSAMRKLEKKELAKTRFLAAASHDLRQPLAAANLYLGSLKLTSPNPQQAELLAQLDLSMATFSGLLDTLLNISKLDAGLVKPELNLVSLAKLFVWLEQNFADMARNKELRFRLFFPTSQLLAIRSDLGLIRSVLMNLVSNAIKFTQQGSILVSARLRGNNILLQVWDTGVGIAEENIGQIFDEFYQVDNPHRNRAEGLGLGLSIAKRTLQLLNSDLSCRSLPGRGTVFSLLLPIEKYGPADDASEQTVQVRAYQASDVSFAAGKRFVIVEDDALIAQSLTSWLEIMGGEVIHFYTAEDALSAPEAEQADYYIVDYMLEGKLNGIQFLNRQSKRQSQPLRAVLVTGDTSAEFIKHAGKCAWPILHKPVTTAQLAAALAAAD